MQSSQRALMEALTFNVASSLASARCRAHSLQSVRDPAARQVVGRKLYSHAVAGQDPDEVHPKLSGDMRQHAVPVLQLYGEHGVRQWLDYRAFDLDRISFRHGRCWVPFSHGMPVHGDRHTKAQHIRRVGLLTTAGRLRSPPLPPTPAAACDCGCGRRPPPPGRLQP